MSLIRALSNLRVQQAFAKEAARITTIFLDQVEKGDFADVTVIQLPEVLDIVQQWAIGNGYKVSAHKTDPTVITASLP